MTEDNENAEPLADTDNLDSMSPEQQVGELNRKVAELAVTLAETQEEAERYRNEVQYKEAELQTERRRFSEQRAAAVKYRDEDLLRDLLPVIEGTRTCSGSRDFRPMGRRSQAGGSRSEAPPGNARRKPHRPQRRGLRPQ